MEKIVIDLKEIEERIVQKLLTEIKNLPFNGIQVEEKPLTPAKAAEALGITRQTLYAWMKKGIIQGHVLGGRRYFMLSEIIKSKKD